MRDFVIRNQLGEVLLAGGAQPCALLGLRRQEGIGGNVQQAGPALPEVSGNRRDVKIMERKGTAESFVKTYGGIDLFAELLERVGRAGRGRRRHDRVSRRGRTEARGREGEGIRVRSGQALPQIFLEFTIGVDIDGMGPGGDGGRGVFAKIKACHGHGLLRLPMASAEFSFLVLFEFGAGGDQAELARPAQKDVIGRKFRAIPEVWVPAFSRTDKQHAVSRVLYDVAPVMKMKHEFLMLRRSLRKDNI